MKPKNKSGRATLGSLGERGLLNWILPRLQADNRQRFLVAPGDDAAVLSSIGRPVLSIDGLAEGTHFQLSWDSRVRSYGLSLGRSLGWKLLGSSLSDLAAMGDVENRWAMIFVGAPPSLKADFLREFF
jgi:thiamine monophosphate kinase